MSIGYLERSAGSEEDGMEHILLWGRRRSGRSALIRRLLREVSAPVFGYETLTLRTRPDGYHQIYLFPDGAENPERVASPEFSTVRNKRAYVNAAIDSLLLEQVKANAKAVAVSDTTALEKRLAEEKAKASGGGEKPSVEAKEAPAAKPAEAKPSAKRPEAKPAQKPVAKRPVRQAPARPLSRREQAIADIAAGDYAAAELQIMEMLAEKPNSAMALNLKASMESAQGKYKEAERTLDQAITSNPRSYYAYYNMASLLLEVNPASKTMAGKYYRAGREVGGPPDPQLEAALK